jgi:hypothetical protein
MASRLRESPDRSAFVLVAAACLTSPAALAQTVVNTDLAPPAPTFSNVRFTPACPPPNPLSPCTTLAPGGLFEVTATFCNGDNNGAGALSFLESVTAALGNGNFLLDDADNNLGGDGSVVPFERTGAYADLVLAPTECAEVDYRIGLQTTSPFAFYVDIVSAPPAPSGTVAIPVNGPAVEICKGLGRVAVSSLLLPAGTYGVNIQGLVRVVDTDPSPDSYAGTFTFPNGCSTSLGGVTVFPRYTGVPLNSLNVEYECFTCP